MDAKTLIQKKIGPRTKIVCLWLRTEIFVRVGQSENNILVPKYLGPAPLSRVGRETGDKHNFLFGLDNRGP